MAEHNALAMGNVSSPHGPTPGEQTLADERTAGVVDRELGDRVRARRLKIGMSQEQLAGLLGVTFQQVQKYEKGVNRIAASRLLDISQALDISVCDFFEGLHAGGKSHSEDMQVLLAKPGVAELVKLFASVRNDKVRKRVLELVRAMAAES